MATPQFSLTPEIVHRRGHQLVYALVACALLGAIALVGGSFINDKKIESDPGRSLATVTDVSWMRTTVSYRDANGVYHAPSTGLLYPTGLGPGQNVWVTHSVSEPELVKVEGRRWTLSIIPALSIAVVSVIIGFVAWWLVSFSTRRWARKRNNEMGDSNPLNQKV